MLAEIFVSLAVFFIELEHWGTCLVAPFARVCAGGKIRPQCAALFILALANLDSLHLVSLGQNVSLRLLAQAPLCP
jgi:hypothetical protein